MVPRQGVRTVIVLCDDYDGERLSGLNDCFSSPASLSAPGQSVNMRSNFTLAGSSVTSACSAAFVVLLQCVCACVYGCVCGLMPVLWWWVLRHMTRRCLPLLVSIHTTVGSADILFPTLKPSATNPASFGLTTSAKVCVHSRYPAHTASGQYCPMQAC